MNNLLTFGYWFKASPGPLDQGVVTFISGLIIVLGFLFILFAILKKRFRRTLYGKIWSNLQLFFLWQAIIGGLFFFFAYETIPFLSARFWFLLWGVGMVVWLVFIAKKIIAIPSRKKELEQENQFKKYIP